MKDSASKHEAGIRMGGMSRRNFVRSAATMAAVAAVVSVKPMLGDNASVVEAAPSGSGSNRSHDCFNYRKNVALAHKVNIRPRPDNGDAARFTDFSWCYSKGLPHDSLGIPNPQAILSLKNAFTSGKSADFANIIVGTPRGGPNSKLTNPQSALAFDLEGMDSHST